MGEPREGRVERDVLLVVDGERLADVVVGEGVEGDEYLRGVTVPGLANAHSHAFHRALRSRAEGGPGDFWSWRRQMYDVADQLDPDRYHRLATALFAEMALAGMSSVGEFHYLHHGSGGAAYDDPNAMGEALVAAAVAAGIRLSLLDACYLSSGFGEPLEGVQRRFGDGSAEAWAERVERLRPGPTHLVGAAVHSVRALQPSAIETVAAAAGRLGAPLHFHLSEQRAENDGCRAAYGCSPTELLARSGALGRRSTAVHATHLTASDVDSLGASGTAVCCCPTTERDLGDGVTPAAALARAGSPLCVGSDSQAVVDGLAEARAIELHERLVTERRGLHDPAALLAAATASGHAAIGWPEAGRLEPGALADFATVSLDSVRLAGTTRATAIGALVFAAGAADVSDLVVGGRRVVRAGEHQLVAEPERALAAALADLAPGDA